MTELVCPCCGETEDLTGTPVDGGIELSCHTCGARWDRGARRCRGCGGTEQVLARQRMTATPRGNQLAVLGYREVPLCPRCDRDVAKQLSTDRLVPDGYTSRFVRGHDEAEHGMLPSGAAAQPPGRRTGHASSASIAGTAASQEPTAAGSSGSTTPPQQERSPTVRQSIASYLQHTEDPDAPSAMLLLGMSLGPATRMDALRAADTRAAIVRTLDRHCGTQPNPRRAALVRAISGAYRQWTESGWITEDQVPQPFVT